MQGMKTDVEKGTQTYVAMHLDLAAITSMSPARGLGHFVWWIDWLYTMHDSTQMPVCAYKYTQKRQR